MKPEACKEFSSFIMKIHKAMRCDASRSDACW